MKLCTRRLGLYNVDIQIYPLVILLIIGLTWSADGPASVLI